MTRRQFAAVLLAASLGTALAAGPQPVSAETKGNQLVEESRVSLERILGDPNTPGLERYLPQARAVLIIPELIKGGFILGAEGGSGVLLVRGADGSWSAPAFYTLAAGSIGLQLGAQISEVVFALMTDGAVEALLDNEMKLGADASVAVGPMGAGIEASTTTNAGADILAFSRAVGLFGGGSLEGAKLISRQELNDEYYGAVAPARAVVIERKFFNPQSDKLRAVLAQPR
jgi:lipid-binding SYLF domain-containing protein